jgi:hypothetical protein
MQFRSARSDFEKQLVLLVALTWGNVNVLSSNVDEVEALVTELDQSRWKRLVSDVRRAASFGPRNKEKVDLDIDTLPEHLSPRVAVLIGQRIQAADRLSRKYLRDFESEDMVVLEFLAEGALDLRRFGRDSWKPDLQVLRKCYKLGQVFVPHNLALDGRRQGPTAMSVDIAKQIALDPLSFPEFLLADAEERCRQEVAASVVPVALKAQQEQWFSV